MIDRTGILSRGGRRIPKALSLGDVSNQQTQAYRATDAYAIPNPKSDPTFTFFNRSIQVLDYVTICVIDPLA